MCRSTVCYCSNAYLYGSSSADWLLVLVFSCSNFNEITTGILCNMQCGKDSQLNPRFFFAIIVFVLNLLFAISTVPAFPGPTAFQFYHFILE